MKIRIVLQEATGTNYLSRQCQLIKLRLTLQYEDLTPLPRSHVARGGKVLRKKNICLCILLSKLKCNIYRISMGVALYACWVIKLNTPNWNVLAIGAAVYFDSKLRKLKLQTYPESINPAKVRGKAPKPTLRNE